MNVDWERYDFLDLGCSSGGSLAYGEGRFGGRGIGIDLDADKVEKARARGVDVVVGDVLELEGSGLVRFVSMFDVLEHLPDLEAVERVIGRAAEIATDFLMIRHPSFESEGLIEHLGVRQYWWGWSGHTAHVRVADYCAMFDRLGLRSYRVHFNDPVTSSSHDSLVPVSARRNATRYDPERDGDKPVFELPVPLWRSQTLFVPLRDLGEQWAEISDRR